MREPEVLGDPIQVKLSTYVFVEMRIVPFVLREYNKMQLYVRTTNYILNGHDDNVL